MSRNRIENRLEDLEPNDDGDAPAAVLNLAHFDHNGKWPDMEESPHPELTIKPFPERKPNSLKIAVPNILPEPYCNEAVLTVVTCDTKHKHTPEGTPEENAPVMACDLWEALSEADLEREKEIREEEGEPIPDFLARY